MKCYLVAHSFIFFCFSCSHQPEKQKRVKVISPLSNLKVSNPKEIKFTNLASESSLKFRLPKVLSELPRSSDYSQQYFFKQIPRTSMSPMRNVTVIKTTD